MSFYILLEPYVSPGRNLFMPRERPYARNELPDSLFTEENKNKYLKEVDPLFTVDLSNTYNTPRQVDYTPKVLNVREREIRVKTLRFAESTVLRPVAEPTGLTSTNTTNTTNTANTDNASDITDNVITNNLDTDSNINSNINSPINSNSEIDDSTNNTDNFNDNPDWITSDDLAGLTKTPEITITPRKRLK